MQPLRPKRLQPGDKVVIAAPSGPFIPDRQDELDSGTEALEAMGFTVEHSPLIKSASRHYWRSGTVTEQAAEVNALLADPEVRAIVPFAGGNSTTGYVDRLDFDAVRADPKPLLGFSDITGLHLALHSQTGLVGMHADFAPGFGSFWDGSTPERRKEIGELVRGLLIGEIASATLPAQEQWETWRPGQATGPLIGGLLDRLIRLQLTPLALAPKRFDGAIFFWEDVGRNIGHIWNDLHALRMQGIFDRIGAMVVGIPIHIQGPAEKYGPVTVKDVVLDVVGEFDFPILGGVDFGHTGPNLPMPIGSLASVDATAHQVRLLESPVA
ncbi:S66 peptidase family protein [Glycomyces buryatensis]|uniref:LD-carboxypeptidase n=1 Tax=Glycomyces buryatensis TaxID=2570927 RepID=A0A4S8QB95_9ACTN|nr:LD-carboxypeptidase [Glycomyces buryatensis]THV41618.1 LD-carboxypeptidase [Glycomyces buryatensis]